MTRRAHRTLVPAAAAVTLAASLLLTGVAQALPPLPPLPLPPVTGPGDRGGAEPGPAPPRPAPAPESPQPAPPASPDPVEPADAGWAGRIVTLTNDERARAGCAPLAVDDRLAAAAQGHARDMADRREMTHVGSDGSTFDERVRAAGYPEPGAENIARGYPDPETTVHEWLASPGHRKNIVNCDHVAIGVGFDPRGNFVVQEFGREE